MRKNCFEFLIVTLLSGCSVWNEEFEGEVIRAYPNASIHQISQMVDKGVINEEDFSGDGFKVFKDGNISRGVEDVRRMYLMTYEDSSKNLHAAHHIYLIVKSAEWSVE